MADNDLINKVRQEHKDGYALERIARNHNISVSDAYFMVYDKQNTKLKARGIKLFLSISPNLYIERKSEYAPFLTVRGPRGNVKKTKWTILIDDLPTYFDSISIDYHSSALMHLLSTIKNDKRDTVLLALEKHPEVKSKLENTMVIKVFCPYTKFKLSTEEAGNFYSKLCNDYILSVSKKLFEKGFKLEGYDFHLVFEHDEKPNEFIPLDIKLPESRIEGKDGIWKRKNSTGDV